MPVERALAPVWFFSLGAFGLMLPFYSLYLQTGAGLSGAQMGLVLAMLPAMGLFAPVLWGQLADRSGRRGQVFAGVMLGTALGYAMLGLQQRVVGFAVGTALLALFSTSVIPLALSVSLALFGASSARSLWRVRVFGTLGFALCVLGFPFARRAWGDLAGDGAGLALIFPGAALFALISAILILRLPASQPVTVRAARGDWRELLRSSAFARTLVFAFGCFFCLQGPMQFFPVLVHAHGGGVEAISAMWAVMLALEVPLVLGFGRLIGSFGARGMIALGMAAAAARWLICGFVGDLRWIGAAQLLHGVTVTGVNLGLPFYADAIVPERLRSTAQGLVAMLGISLAAIFSNLGAGWLFDRLGPEGPMRAAGFLAAGVTALTFAILPGRQRAPAQNAALQEMP